MKTLPNRIVPPSVVLALVFATRASAQIANAGFETWDDCIPADWATPNVCGTLMPITRTPNANSGSFAARGEVISFFGQAIQPVLQSGDTGEGTPISSRYSTLHGSYKFAPVGGDRFGVNVVFYRNGVVVALGAFADPVAAAAYTPFAVTMNYFSADVPDTATIQIQIVGPVTGFDFHVGSTMQVDSLSYTIDTVAPPVLSILRVGDKLEVSWPADVTGYTLESTATIPQGPWTPVAGVSNNHVLLVPDSKAYYRLAK